MGGRYAQSLILYGVSLQTGLLGAEQECFTWNIFHADFLYFSAFSVLVALIVGRTIQLKCRFPAQPIWIQRFNFALPVFLDVWLVFTYKYHFKYPKSIKTETFNRVSLSASFWLNFRNRQCRVEKCRTNFLEIYKKFRYNEVRILFLARLRCWAGGISNSA